jgi:hypothetical protein
LENFYLCKKRGSLLNSKIGDLFHLFFDFKKKTVAEVNKAFQILTAECMVIDVGPQRIKKKIYKKLF